MILFLDHDDFQKARKAVLVSSVAIISLVYANYTGGEILKLTCQHKK